MGGYTQASDPCWMVSFKQLIAQRGANLITLHCKLLCSQKTQFEITSIIQQVTLPSMLNAATKQYWPDDFTLQMHQWK